MTGEVWLAALVIAAVTGVGVALALRPLIGWLRQRAVWDVPNERSSHVEITPRGGGIAVTLAILLGGTVWLTLQPDALSALVLVGMAALGIVSWLDDRRGGLPVGLRLGVQACAVGLALLLLPADSRIVSGAAIVWLPLWLERLVCLLAWLWFTNLFNFMDGINGITGGQTAAIGLGLAVVHVVTAGPASTAGLALVVAAAGLGFLPWNWGHARVFLGDVGSVPLGFLLGWLLLDAAVQGYWAVALILPLYYWGDATVTLLRRMLRGEKIWQAHRSHFYQQGARKFGSHAAVAGRIALLNLLLILLSLLSLLGWGATAIAMAAAGAATLGLCRHFAGAPKPLG